MGRRPGSVLSRNTGLVDTLLFEKAWSNLIKELFTRSAECWWYTGHVEEALAALQTIFEKARSSIDKAPSWILQSRIYTQAGDTKAAFRALKQCLELLGLNIEDEISWEQCDVQYHGLYSQLQSMDRAKLLGIPSSMDRNVVAMGGLFSSLLLGREGLY